MKPGEYEAIRLRNLEDNKRILASFGLMNPFKPVQCVMKKKNRPVSQPRGIKRKPQPPAIDLLSTGSLYGTRRKSARLSGQDVPDLGSTYEEVDDEEEKTPKSTPMNRPKIYGAIDGIEVGTEWDTRLECCKDGIHRPTVAGIHGGEDGAYSIALSGGYEDDVDLGDCFTYTGEGGRDLKGTKANPKNLRTAPQSKDQTLTRGNLALSRNVETGNPVRVIRGYKLHSQFAPEEGYRYDGLYSVEKCWFTTGLSGFGVYKFALKRCPGQDAAPWKLLQDCRSSKPSSDAGEENGFEKENQEHNQAEEECDKHAIGDHVELKDYKNDSSNKSENCEPTGTEAKTDNSPKGDSCLKSQDNITKSTKKTNQEENHKGENLSGERDQDLKGIKNCASEEDSNHNKVDLKKKQVAEDLADKENAS